MNLLKASMLVITLVALWVILPAKCQADSYARITGKKISVWDWIVSEEKVRATP